MDQPSINAKMVMRLLASPLTLAPFLVGATLLLGLWAVGIHSTVAVFAGISLMAGALGVFFTRLVTGKDRLASETLADMQQEAALAREKELDDLDRRLNEDDEPRNERLLRDLRALVR